MKVYIKNPSDYYHIVRYVLKLIEQNKEVKFTLVEDVSDAELVWDETHPNSEPINKSFYKELSSKPENYTHQEQFQDETKIRTSSGKQDVIATIFYMVNCLQELYTGDKQLDEFGRFQYQASYQNRFNCTTENLVQQEMDAFCLLHQLQGKDKDSSFFISHDIDTIYGSFIQDGAWAAKHLRIDVILTLIMNELIRKPEWKNMDQIISINSEYDIRSTFFWLVNKGRGNQGIMNADYDIKNEKSQLKIVSSAYCHNGLHKSSSDMTIEQELAKGELNTVYNRYHFLKYHPHEDWREISESSIKLDCSLGFAEHYGFRNSYGRVFQPFDLANQKPFDFVSAPLAIMDGTFHRYMKSPTASIGDTIIEFIENNRTNCHHSILWHNTYFTSYKYGPFLKEYKKVLGYIYENKLRSLGPDELIEQGTLEW